jgi:hypothetical protein
VVGKTALTDLISSPNYLRPPSGETHKNLDYRSAENNTFQLPISAKSKCKKRKNNSKGINKCHNISPKK